MSDFEVDEPILCSPFEEPGEHWDIRAGETPRRVPGRRPAMYHYRPATGGGQSTGSEGAGTIIELRLVNRIRTPSRSGAARGMRT